MAGTGHTNGGWQWRLPPARYAAYLASLALTAAAVPLLWLSWWGLLPLLVFGALATLGTWDVLQRRRTVSRNYPILAHFRYGFESIGPEIRQYFIESDMEKRPFSREQRALVYQRAKGVLDSKPFGSLLDMYEEDYEWLNPSLRPAPIAHHDFRVEVGGTRKQPYSASLFNITAMSYGSLSANAITALNIGARDGGFYHDTGEGSIAPYHRQGGDLVWEIGSGYFGCRDEQGRFDPALFAEKAVDPQVKMIEIKLSQGAKPGHGGVLPGVKVTPEIAAIRHVPVGKTVVSPSSHSAFSTPLELLAFIARLRQLSGDKPVGFKLAIGHPWEWFGIVKAMLETGEYPDFIVVDGAEGGTGAAPIEFINHVGLPLREALLLVHNTLVGANLRQYIRIAAAGQVVSAFDVARMLALGADWCNAGRGFMFALGCIQARQCHTGLCPSGVATQDTRRSRHLDVPSKSERVRRFHENTLKALAEMIAAAGINHPRQLGPQHMLSRVSTNEIRSFAELYRFLDPGELLDGREMHGVYRKYWPAARADSFDPPQDVYRLRENRRAAWNKTQPSATDIAQPRAVEGPA
ncbi:MAG TPA: FMN-binding glutamate synthase family protein [Rhodanobacteraceae bacterium]|nr:FMN-binding glutamate synthase family protein [Rhodanobacteraceae bacterium]